jgi:hypothetical protein
LGPDSKVWINDDLKPYGGVMAQALEFVAAGYLRHAIEQSGIEGTSPHCNVTRRRTARVQRVTQKIGILLIDDDKRGRGRARALWEA